MKLTNEELDALLTKAGLRLDQEYNPRCSYRKTEWLHTACLACGTQADYRLAYILDKNAIGEKVCRACYWREWHRGEEDIHYTNGMSLVEAKRRLVAMGFMATSALEKLCRMDLMLAEFRGQAMGRGAIGTGLCVSPGSRGARSRSPAQCLTPHCRSRPANPFPTGDLGMTAGFSRPVQPAVGKASPI